MRRTVLFLAVLGLMITGGVASAEKPSRPPGGADQQAQIDALEERVSELEALLEGVERGPHPRFLDLSTFTFPGDVQAWTVDATEVDTERMYATERISSDGLIDGYFVEGRYSVYGGFPPGSDLPGVIADPWLSCRGHGGVAQFNNAGYPICDDGYLAQGTGLVRVSWTLTNTTNGHEVATCSSDLQTFQVTLGSRSVSVVCDGLTEWSVDMYPYPGDGTVSLTYFGEGAPYTTEAAYTAIEYDISFVELQIDCADCPAAP